MLIAYMLAKMLAFVECHVATDFGASVVVGARSRR